MNYSSLRNLSNIVDTGTEGTRVALGTTSERGSTVGQLRYNSDNGNLEYYNGQAFQSIDKSPTISGISPTLIDKTSGTSATTDIVITGTKFVAGATVKAIASNNSEVSAGTVVVNSDTQITATFTDSYFLEAQEPYDIKVSNADGLSATIDNVLYVDTASTFTTSSGSLGTLTYSNGYASSNLTNVVATDAEGEAITMSIQSGTTPPGLTFGSDGVWSGTATEPSSNTTYSFTVRATSGTLTTDRSFTIQVNAPVQVLIMGGSAGAGGIVNGYSQSSQLGHHNGSYIYDGNPNRPNEWHSAGGDTSGWAQANWNTGKIIWKITVRNRNDCCNNINGFRVYGRNSDGSLTQIATGSTGGGSSGQATVTSSNSSTNFHGIRVQATSTNGGYASIGEVYVYSKQ